jgi:hypothetical protein
MGRSARAGAPDAPTLVIACGALAREITHLIDANGWQERIRVACLPAILHNRPERIPALLRQRIRAGRRRHARVMVAYADCGTGGLIDRVLEEEGAERIAGAHCYEFYAGRDVFARLSDADPACFYLTDYLARHFDRLIIAGLGLDRHPELRDDYFQHYTRLVYLAQTDDPALRAKAEAAAHRLGLVYEYRPTGYGELGDFVAAAARTH